MKKVFKNNFEVCHIWASQTQKEGRANNIFFENKSIYSYGKHFEIARFYKQNNNEVVLFTTQSYSMTTAQHMGLVKNAISHYQIFYVPFVNGEHEENIKDYLKRIDENRILAIRARKNGEYPETDYVISIFTEQEKNIFNLPIEGRWELF